MKSTLHGRDSDAERTGGLLGLELLDVEQEEGVLIFGRQGREGLLHALSILDGEEHAGFVKNGRSFE